ncbi:hypothetical protein GCM10011390_22690 [Aureimonas endophytica]|uniref:HTH cro/C1-type domain-containing protein n=1 Tax=Aureimonas endophytica TaxID=2027858 RepID=A0A916ZLY3_9HYPH|nr:helix-turn-helix transcriptional regulator [Aureimonas endophytica]GGE03292.1 hypothetical protein GCM10011390_22690 [Aureimonas endophytica]
MIETYELPNAIVEQMTNGVAAIRAFRRHSQQSITGLSERTGIVSSRLHSLEGGAIPRQDEVKALAAAFGIPARLLTSGA